MVNSANLAPLAFDVSRLMAVPSRAASLAIATDILKRATLTRAAAYASTTPSVKIASDARPVSTVTRFVDVPTTAVLVHARKAGSAWRIPRAK